MRKTVSILLFFILLLTLFMGNLTFSYTKEALLIWFEKLVPSLFISMVLVRTIYALHGFDLILSFLFPVFQKIFRLDKASTSLLFSSMLLGFPSGSLLIDEEYEKGMITEDDARRLLYTCSFATPGFIIMSCGVVLYHSVAVGFQLLAIQLVCGLILVLFSHQTKEAVKLSASYSYSIPSPMICLGQAVLESGKTLYMIGGYLMLFMTICSLCLQFFPDAAALPIRIMAEFSSGTILISQLTFEIRWLYILTSMLLGFGGFCVHMQVISMVNHVSISYRKYLLYRMLQALLCGIAAWLIF